MELKFGETGSWQGMIYWNNEASRKQVLFWLWDGLPSGGCQIEPNSD